MIALAARWDVRWLLSSADVVDWLAERGGQVDASTICDYLVRVFTRRFIAAARPHCPAVAKRWRVDPTYLRIVNRWHYLYRVIDDHRPIVDVYVSDGATQPQPRLFEASVETSPFNCNGTP